jgi:hypothetical protein
MDGWCPVEGLTQRGFGHAPVLMADEAHSGMRRCARTRVAGPEWPGRPGRPGRPGSIEPDHGRRGSIPCRG